MTFALPRPSIGFVVGALLVALPQLAVGDGDVEDAAEPGAYCPLPEPGQKATCIEPAQAEYGDFFDALDAGQVDSSHAEGLEADFAAGALGDRTYLALSAITYGYWRLTQRASSTGEMDAETRARLDRWNDLIAETYARSSDDPELQAEVRAAALDLHENASVDEIRCTDQEGNQEPCRPTVRLLASLDRVDEELGVRGAIKRVLREVLAGDSGQ